MFKNITNFTSFFRENVPSITKSTSLCSFHSLALLNVYDSSQMTPSSECFLSFCPLRNVPSPCEGVLFFRLMHHASHLNIRLQASLSLLSCFSYLYVLSSCKRWLWSYFSIWCWWSAFKCELLKCRNSPYSWILHSLPGMLYLLSVSVSEMGDQSLG